MFEITQPPPAAVTLARPPSYAGHERRATGSDLAHWLRRMLDEIDYGMLMVTGDGQVSYFNHAARLELDGSHPLQMLGRTLRAHRPQDVAPLYDALAAAQRGLRRLLTLGDGDQRVSVSVVPLPQAGGGEHGAGGAEQRPPLVLLV
ncbi:MAG: PAS domain-containing protein, partial [Rubrivivax sp.]|nr:PAS domain-containing protein [Rubrivivax sp.]